MSEYNASFTTPDREISVLVWGDEIEDHDDDDWEAYTKGLILEHAFNRDLEEADLWEWDDHTDDGAMYTFTDPYGREHTWSHGPTYCVELRHPPHDPMDPEGDPGIEIGPGCRAHDGCRAIEDAIALAERMGYHTAPDADEHGYDAHGKTRGEDGPEEWVRILTCYHSAEEAAQAPSRP